MAGSNGSGHALSEAERAALVKLRDKHGEEKAAQLVGVSGQTYARACAGFGLQRGTRLLLRVALADLGEEAA